MSDNKQVIEGDNSQRTPTMADLNRLHFLNAFDEIENSVIRDPKTKRILRPTKGSAILFDGADDELIVKFTTVPVFSKLESWRAGGAVKYVDMDFVTIYHPNHQVNEMIHTIADEYHKFRFPLEWEAYLQNKESPVVGTPLTLWAGVSPSQIKELEHYGIKSIENLASLPEKATGALRQYQHLRDKARDYLEQQEKNANAAQMQAELAKRDEETAELKKQLAELTALIKAKPAAAKKTYGKKAAKTEESAE